MPSSAGLSLNAPFVRQGIRVTQIRFLSLLTSFISLLNPHYKSQIATEFVKLFNSTLPLIVKPSEHETLFSVLL